MNKSIVQFDPFVPAIARAVQHGIRQQSPGKRVAAGRADVPNWPAESGLQSFVTGIDRQPDAMAGVPPAETRMDGFDRQAAVIVQRDRPLLTDTQPQHVGGGPHALKGRHGLLHSCKASMIERAGTCSHAANSSSVMFVGSCVATRTTHQYTRRRGRRQAIHMKQRSRIRD